MRLQTTNTAGTRCQIKGRLAVVVYGFGLNVGFDLAVVLIRCKMF